MLSFYRDTTEFNSLLDRLRNRNKVVKFRGSRTVYTGRTSLSDCASSEQKDEDHCVTDISEIVFLDDPSTDNDAAAGALGDALQVQLHNVLTLNESYDTDNVVVDVVNHLEIVLQGLSTDFEKYRSLLQYIENHVYNPYLETITISANSGFTMNQTDREHTLLRNSIISEFLLVLQQKTQTTPQSTTITGTGLQKLIINDCFFLNAPTFVAFIHQMSIPILEMDCFSFMSSENEDENDNSIYDIITDAFRKNTTIQELYFDVDYHTAPYITMVLKQLMHNTTLLRLRLEWSIFDFIELDDGNNNVAVIPRVEEFFLALVCYLKETKTMQHIALSEFQFVGKEILPSLLSSISSNRSIQVLTLQKCMFDDYNWRFVFPSQFQRLVHIQRFEMYVHVKADDAANDRRMSHFLHSILPSNVFIQQLCVLPEQFLDGTMVIHDDDELFLLSYLRRNRGIKQFIQQYVKGMNSAILTGLTVPGSQPLNDNTAGVGCASIFDINNCLNSHLLNKLHEPLHTAMQKQRREDHQYHSVRRKQYATNTATTTMSCCVDGRNRKVKKENISIPIELVPTILANHFQSTSNNYCYGHTIIYQMFSNMNFNHCGG